MPNQPFMQVDAFTDQPFSGYPLDPARHFVSRFFAPASDVPEDPVTGSISVARR